MKRGKVRKAAICVPVLLTATALLVLQLTGGGGVTASDSNQEVSEGAVFSRVIAEREPVELIEQRDDHTRVWQIEKEVERTHPDGRTTVETVKSYIHEKGSGLCYRHAGGNFVPSVAEWRETPDGFVIDRCGYWLSIGNTIGSGLRYIVDGHELLLRGAYLMISDGVNEAHLGVLNPNAVGFIVPGSPSVIRFPSAFGPGYDLEYVVETGGFHQNLIIAERPKLPDGFDPARTGVHLYTEMNLDEYLAASGLEVLVEGEEINAGTPDLMAAVSRGGCIAFCSPTETGDGEGRLVHGFGVSAVADSPVGGAVPKETAAEKRLLKSRLARRAYLVESLPFSYLADEPMPSYPVVWDFQNITEPIDGGTWEPRYTYWVSDNIWIQGTLTILPGTTVKINPSKSINIVTGGKIVAKGEPYNYVTFTKASDGNCGEPLPGAPAGNSGTAIDLWSGSSPSSVIQYCKIGNATTGLYVRRQLTSWISHNIFRNNTTNGVALQSCSTTTCHNNLITGSQRGIYSYSCSYSPLTNNTIDNCSTGIRLEGAYNCGVYDCLITNCSAYGVSCSGGNPLVDYCAFWRCPTPVDPPGQGGAHNKTLPWGTMPYAAVSGLGDYYLSDYGASELGNAGHVPASTVGLDQEVFTIRAPFVVSGTLSGAVTWSKICYDSQGQPYSIDTGLVCIGYHHNRVDRYVSDNCVFSGSSASLTINPGVVVGIRGDKYLSATNGAKLTSVGDPGSGGLILFTNSKSLSMNIESPMFGVYGSNPYVDLYTNPSADSRILFTRTTWLGLGILVGVKLNEPIQDNVFSLSYQGVHAGLVGNTLLNNLIHENVRGVYAWGNGEVANCTFDRNQTGLELGADAGQKFTIRDSLFTKNSSQGILINACSGQVVNYFNGFWENGVPITGGTPGNGSRELSSGSCPYEEPNAADWQARYRIRQSSTVVDGGSVKAADVGLAAYTTATDNRYDVKHVDMGFHLLARPTIWVDDDYAGQYGDSNGSRLKPYNTIGDALSSVGANTTVLVLPGEYLYGQGQQVTAVSSVHLIGSGAPVTTLDGQRIPNDSWPYVSCPLIKIDNKSDVTVAAMAITGRFNEERPAGENDGPGGGVICKDSMAIVIRDSLISYNDADYGGGIYINNSNVTIEDTTIHQNKAISGVAGGGIYITSCNSLQGRGVTVRRSLISNNAAASPDEFGIGGGGIFCTSASDPMIEDCVISYNRAASQHGGGIYLDTNCSATIRNCIVEHNVARHNTDRNPSPTYPGYGGGIWIQNSSPVISGCTISNNGSVWRGAGISCYGGSSAPLIVNCTVVYNTDLLPEDQYPTAGVWSNGAHPTIVNCIIWGNGDDLAGGTGAGMATYSCIEDTGAENEGQGNIHGDPILIGSIYGPYHLGYGSPCIEAGTPDTSGLPIPVLDIDGDARLIGRIDMGSDERHRFRDIVSIKRDFGQNKVILTWQGENGRSYGVYRSLDPFTNYMAWQYRTDVIATGELASWEDTSINFQTEEQRYYKVLDKNGTYAGTWTRPVGFVNADLDFSQDPQEPDKYESTFFAVPLELKYDAINVPEEKDEESLARMMAGHLDVPGEHLEENDQIEFIKLGCPDRQEAPLDLIKLQLKWIGPENAKKPKWYTVGENPAESPDRFSVGEVFRILKATGSRTKIAFLGFVPSRPVGLLAFRSLWAYFSVDFGYPYPVRITLNDIPFLDHGAVGAPDEDHAPDCIYTPSPVGELQSETLWLKDDGQERGVWYHGTARAGSPLYDVIPGKGFRYFGRLLDPESGGAPGGLVWDNIYWRRTPVSRPYRSQ